MPAPLLPPAGSSPVDSTSTATGERPLGLVSATSLNIANMIGAGPFITIGLFIATMGGPQAMIGWVAAAVLVLCDGLVWSELGAALPGNGGSYHFLRETFGRTRFGAILPFLFIWQFLISGTLELASGYLGAAEYVKYAFPTWEPTLKHWGLSAGLPWLAAGCALLVSLVLCARIKTLGWLSIVLCAGSLITVLIVIVSGILNFDASLITFPENAWRLDRKFASGLGGAMLIAIYDYLGYYNICHLGGEVRDPGRTIPRAVMLSVLVVAAVYLTMNLCIIGVIPWQEAMKSNVVAAVFMERLFGREVAVVFTWLILWTVLACVFAMTLGYSRIPLAAARRGDFFAPFAWVHPRWGSPYVSLFALGVLTAGFCFVDLGWVISAAVAVRIGVQFIAQIAALHWLRKNRPDVPRPFKMRWYPLPSLIALAGWIFVLFNAESKILWAAVAVLLSGVLAFVLRQAMMAKGPLWPTRS